MMFFRKSFLADGSLSLSLSHSSVSFRKNADPTSLQHQHLMIALNSADAKVGTQQKTEKKYKQKRKGEFGCATLHATSETYVRMYICTYIPEVIRVYTN
jgi:hypothetical protein